MSVATAHDLAAADYRRLLLRRGAVLAGLTLLLLVALVCDVMTGPSRLPFADVLSTILSPDGATGPMRVIVWDVRLPYALMAVLVGAALALAGAEMQTVLNNPLASPFTLGVSSAASLGAALAIVLGRGVPWVPQDWLIPANAFVFAFASMLLLHFMSRLRGAGVDALVLFGIALVFAMNALVALLQFVATEQALQQLVFWSMGSLARATWPKIGIMALALAVCVPFCARATWKLTALRLGEDRARSFGVDATALRRGSLLRVSLLAAVSVAFVGTIGFVGLVGPHAARLMVGEDHRYFLPASALCGAVLLSLSSIASKMIVPGLLIPIGIVTALIGVPVFVALVFGRARAA
ncbi:iron ABC transporter permease [Roseomonas gilardii]|uniref:Iron ABC transporter permease n=1 Tax=Roseomonas gilardii TaxID=257708 RepID=A0A1L7AFV1_9PROT|nr:iron ABC transporter permease [Roseomonas gilardii]APT57643.1 iron ABC transporter permease [Roseomonas gilardii]MDT8329826.1 iron ABC transporter permease [Roseomonas gilardii]PZR17841.1 MAG: iron ABC transporter permease [Azospirillum brasilense]